MKIICDSCGTKYSIADEKVKGKVFKIRCKKCRHIIVVRDTSDDAPGDQPAASQEPAGGGDFGDTPVWHVVVDREQVGPMTAAEVRDRFAAGEINGDTYTWREGFADWVRLSTVDDFTELGDAADDGAAAGGGDLFGGTGGGQQLFPDDGGGEQAGEGDDVQMTGQRGENSVLFSLSNLQHLARGSTPASSAAPSIAPTSGAKEGVGSGLIDIRGMAASTAPSPQSSAGGDADLPVLGGFSAPVAAAPVLMPAVADARPKWLLPALFGGSALSLVAITILLVVLLTREKPRPVPIGGALARVGVTNPETGTATKKPADEGQAATDEKKDDEGQADEGQADEGNQAAAKPVRRASKRKSRRGRSGRRPSRATRDEPPPAPRNKPTRERGKQNDLDRLIDDALGGGRKPSRRPAARAPAQNENLPETLGRSQIQGGMREIRGRVQRCYDRFKVPGRANIRVKIGRNGRVFSARVQGIFSGTPTGACVAPAVRSASFPRFKGAPITVTYPFVLR